MKDKLRLIWTTYKALPWPKQVFGYAVAAIIVIALLQAILGL